MNLSLPSLSGLSGLQSASRRVERAAKSLVVATAPVQDTAQLSPEARRIMDGGPEKAVVEQVESVLSYRAQVKTIKMADERFETLIDLMR